MAKNKKKNRGKKQQFVKLSPKAYIKKVARKLPIHECRIYDNWKEEGKTQILVSRKRANGQLLMGFYLVDLWCLGLKDSFFREMEPSEYESIVERISNGITAEMGAEFINCEPQLAFNIIYGAVEYAEDLGFEPAKEFATTEYMLDDVEEIEYVEVEFGKNGRPCYTTGPDDNVQRILKVLNKNVGEGNYEFVLDLASLGNENDRLDPAAHPYSTRPEAEKMAEKFEEEESDENAIEYMYQLMAADSIHRILEGDLTKLANAYAKDIEIDVVEELASIINSDMPGIVGDSEREDLKRLVKIVIAQMMHYGNGEFFFHDNYQPILPMPSKEQLRDMSDEMFQTWQEELRKRETPDERYNSYIKMVAFKEVATMFDLDEPQTFTEEDKIKVIQKVTKIFEEAKGDSQEKMSEAENLLIEEEVRKFLQFIEEEQYTETED